MYFVTLLLLISNSRKNISTMLKNLLLFQEENCRGENQKNISE